jgi:hypothetical protein
MKRFNAVAVLVALVLFAGTAFAQGTVLGWGNKPTPPQSGTSVQGQVKVSVVGGVAEDDSAGTPMQFDVLGNLKVNDTQRDRDFPLITQLFSGQQLTCKQTYAMTYAVPTLQYTRNAIMLTWACAAVDTDSVRIAVRVYGTTSSTSGNWHLWTPMATYGAGDTCMGPATSISTANDSLTVGRCLKPVSFWVGRAVGGVESAPFIYGDHTTLLQATSTTAGTRYRVRKIPAYALRWGSANAVMLNLTDNTGAPCPFPYIRIEVSNCTGASSGIVGASCAITNLEANIWSRVQ